MDHKIIVNEVQWARIQLSARRVLQLQNSGAYSLLEQMDHTFGVPYRNGKHFAHVLRQMAKTNIVEMVFDYYELVCYLVGSEDNVSMYVANDPDRLSRFIVRNNNPDTDGMLDALNAIRKDRKKLKLAALN